MGELREKHLDLKMENLIKAVFVSALLINTVSSTLQCYNCGYRTLNGGEPEPLPEGDYAYCSDFANPPDIVTNCTQPSDCCASMKERITRVNETSGGNYTEVIAKHGCGSDIGEIEGRHHYCSEHPNSCFNVDDATFPNKDNISTIIDIEVCFCSNNRCNAEDPIFPPPDTTTSAPGGSPATVASIILVILGALLIVA